MAVLAISGDPAADSRRFAGAYGIEFPLLADPDGAVSRQYVGVDGSDTTIPGIVLVRRDGTIAFRQIARDKADRLTAAQLVATVDRVLGRGAGAPGVRGGYAALERWQLRVDAGGGAHRVDRAVPEPSGPADTRATDWRGAGRITVTGLVPLARVLAVGTAAGGTTRDLDLDGVVALRLPILASTGALELTGLLGGTVAGLTGLHAGLRVGAWVAWTPDWGFQLTAGLDSHDVGHRDDLALTATLGLTRLFVR